MTYLIVAGLLAGATALGLLAATDRDRFVDGVIDQPLPASLVKAPLPLRASAIEPSDLTTERSPLPFAFLDRDPATAATAPASLLPPDDTPVAELLTLLGERARQGEVAAACRLAAELHACQFSAFMRRSMSSLSVPPPNLPAERMDAWIDQQAKRLEHDERMEAHCAGVSQAEHRQWLRYQAIAAAAGHRPSITSFVSTASTFGGGQLVTDPALAEFYRRHAWPMLRAAMAAGDLDAGHVFASMTMQPEFSPLVDLVPLQFNDPEAARALSQRLRAINSGANIPLPTIDRPISPDAEARADAWFNELYGDVELLPQPPRESSTLFHPSRVAQFRCEDPDALLPAAAN